jgi:hypothetical protein
LKSKLGVKGSCVSTSGRKLACASWHAHGYIFDEIFKLEPNAMIYSLGQKIDKYEGNWKDRQIGSMSNPKYYSETSIL